MMLNTDAPMADLLNRGMVAALIGIVASFALYDYVHNWRLLLASSEQVMKLAEAPFVTVGALIAVSSLAQWLWPKGSSLILPSIGGLGVVLLATVGIRVYALTKGLEALQWDYWLVLALMAGLCVAAPLGYWFKPKEKVVSKHPKKTRFWFFVPVLLMIVMGGFGLWGMVHGDPDSSRFGVYAVFFGFQALLPQFDKYPALRIAAITLALAVALIGLAFFVVEGGIGFIVRHWDVALVVAYLLLMWLVWFGYQKWQALKK